MLSVRTWARFMVELVAVLVLIFVVMIWTSFVEITPHNVLGLDGIVVDYQKTDSGELELHLAEYKSTLYVGDADMRYFDESSFMQEVHPGDQLHIAISKNAQASLHSSEGLKVAALEIRSDTITFLPLTATAAVRKHEHMVTIPLIGLGALAVLILFTVLSIRAKDYKYLGENLSTYLTSRMPKEG